MTAWEDSPEPACWAPVPDHVRRFHARRMIAGRPGRSADRPRRLSPGASRLGASASARGGSPGRGPGRHGRRLVGVPAAAARRADRSADRAASRARWRSPRSSWCCCRRSRAATWSIAGWIEVPAARRRAAPRAPARSMRPGPGSRDEGQGQRHHRLLGRGADAQQLAPPAIPAPVPIALGRDDRHDAVDAGLPGEPEQVQQRRQAGHAPRHVDRARRPRLRHDDSGRHHPAGTERRLPDVLAVLEPQAGVRREHGEDERHGGGVRPDRRLPADSDDDVRRSARRADRLLDDQRLQHACRWG